MGEVRAYRGGTEEIEDPYVAGEEVNQSRRIEEGEEGLSGEKVGVEKNAEGEKEPRSATSAEERHTDDLMSTEGNNSKQRMVEAARVVEILEEIDCTDERGKLPRSAEKSGSQDMPEMPLADLGQGTDKTPDWVIPRCNDRDEEEKDEMVIYHRRPRSKKKQMDNQDAIRWAQNLEVPPTAAYLLRIQEQGGRSEASNNEGQR